MSALLVSRRASQGWRSARIEAGCLVEGKARLTRHAMHRSFWQLCIAKKLQSAHAVLRRQVPNPSSTPKLDLNPSAACSQTAPLINECIVSLTASEPRMASARIEAGCLVEGKARLTRYAMHRSSRLCGIVKNLRSAHAVLSN